MQQQNIPLNQGIHRTPSIEQPGELSECVNIMPSHGEMVNIPVPTERFQVQSNHNLMYVHESSGSLSYRNFITTVSGAELYVNGSLMDFHPAGEILEVTSIGNTLAVSVYGKGVYYMVWKYDHYKNLGNHLPEVGLSFGLAGRFVYERGDIVTYDPESDFREKTVNGEEHFFLSESFSDRLNNSIYYALNKLEHKSKVNGYFNYPFFVRYALRLYDGANTMHSAPILLIPEISGMPNVFVTKRDSVNESVPVVAAVQARLTCTNSGGNDMSDWSDIIQGVDIFVSPQVQRYNESGKQEREVKKVSVWSNVTVQSSLRGLFYSQGYTGAASDWNKKQWPLSPLGSGHWTQSPKIADSVFISNGYAWEIDSMGEEEYKDRVGETSQFFLAKSLQLDALKNFSSRAYIDFGKDVLETLTTRRALVEDTNYSHDLTMPNKIFAYNSRLIIADTRRTPSDKIVSEALFPAVGSSNYKLSAVQVLLGYDRDSSPYPFVRLQTKANVSLDFTNGELNYLFYPDPKAVAVQINGAGINKMVKLKPHPYLHGAYAFNGFDELDTCSYSTSSDITYMEQPNRLFISEVDNPFLFLGSKAVTLPSRVNAISTAARALSQGQFGQFPLYAFCEDGIWAISVGADGKLESKQPISRDVIIPDSRVCQLDDSVAYLTKEGVKIIRGSETRCISEVLNGAGSLPATRITEILPDNLSGMVPKRVGRRKASALGTEFSITEMVDKYGIGSVKLKSCIIKSFYFNGQCSDPGNGYVWLSGIRELYSDGQATILVNGEEYTGELVDVSVSWYLKFKKSTLGDISGNSYIRQGEVVNDANYNTLTSGTFITKGNPLPIDKTPPEIVNVDIEELSSDAARIVVTVLFNDYDVVVYLRYKKSSDADSPGNWTKTDQLENKSEEWARDEVFDIADLSGNTQYDYEAVVEYGAGEKVTRVGKFTTPAGSVPDVPDTPGATVSKPEVIIQSVTSVTKSSATVNFTVKTNGANCSYKAKISEDHKLYNDVLPSQSVITDKSTTQQLSMPLSGLKQNTTYYVKIIVSNTAGTVGNESEKSFTTLKDEVAASPSIYTNAPVFSEDYKSATIKFSIETEGQEVTYSVTLLNKATNETKTVAENQKITAGLMAAQNCSHTVTGLTRGVNYSYKVEATNKGGNKSATHNFYVPADTSSKPLVTSLWSFVEPRTASLHCHVYPNELPTTCYVTYKNQQDNSDWLNTSSQTVLATETNGRDLTFKLTGLELGKFYAWKVVAKNSKGTYTTEEFTFWSADESTGIPVYDATNFRASLGADTLMLFDSVNRLLHVFNEQDGDAVHAHYVYGLDTQQWAVQVLPASVETVVPGYPLSYMQMGTDLYVYDTINSDDARTGYLITRPLRLGNPLSRKALYDLRVLCQQLSDKKPFSVIVLISNDGVSWYKLTSLKAKSAKYYRVVICTNLTDQETLQGISLLFDERYNHKLR